MANFFTLRKRPYADDDISNKANNKHIAKFSIFVISALVIVGIIMGSIFYFNFRNNSLRMFVKTSSNVFDCGSFEYEVKASINSQTYMEYKGKMQFDLNTQQILSYYHADYKDYKYDAVVCSKGNLAVRGNYYGGKWTVEDYTASALDFCDFYGDYRNYKFNAAAATRFLGNTKTFNSTQLEDSVSAIFDELSKSSSLNGVLNQKITQEDGSTIVTFTPKMDEVANIITKHIAPAYSSANDYNNFKENIISNSENLKNVKATIMYTYDENEYLTDAILNYTVDGKTYSISVKLGGFGNSKPQIPESFFAAANSQL